jgi:methylmalonyl-CoA mutase, N-terminal domain
MQKRLLAQSCSTFAPKKGKNLAMATARKADSSTVVVATAPAPEFKTMSGIPLKSSYGPDDLTSRGWTYEKDLGAPGQYPYTRGPHETMYRGKPWTMRMFAGFGTPEDTNKRFKFLLESGTTGLSTAFDMPTLMGYDPDNERSLGEVGREGVSVATIDDMMRLFGDIPLDKVSTSMTINAPAAVLLALYVAVAERQGVAPAQLRGTLQNDMLKEFIAQKEWISPIRAHMRIIRDMLAWCTTTMPQWNTISISGYHIREAGATAVQELAFTLADGIGYVQLGIDAGLDVDSFAPRLSYFFDVHNDFFEEIAKFRAARRMWAKIMKERFGAKNPKSWLLRTHAQTAGVSLMAQQPLNNVVRTTLQGLAAVLGGTQSLHTNSYDETYALPTEDAAMLALRTQQVIYEESNVAAVTDPLAGSYFIETLTDQVEAAAWEYIHKIDAMGGIVKAVEEGYPQREISRSAFEFQREVDTKRRNIVGVNKYKSPEDGDGIPTLKIEHEVEENQVASIRRFRMARDQAVVDRHLAAVKAALNDDKQNLMPPIFEAVKNNVTLGEICDLFRSELGVYTDPAYL